MDFDVSFEHIRGQNNALADMLSRTEYQNEKSGKPNVNLLASDIVIKYDDIVRLQQEDTSIQDIKQNQNDSLEIVNRKGVLYDVSKGHLRLILPKSLRKQEIARLHNLSHPGFNGTYRMVAERFVWKNMRSDIKYWVKCCQHCQSNKIGKHTKAQLGQLPNGSKFEVIHADIVGKLPQNKGYQYIFTIIDRETNWTEAIAMREINSERIFKAFTETLVSRYRVPAVMITDQGTQFTSNIFKKCAEALGIELRTTTAYHPQCNGKIERFHRILKDLLRAHIDSNGGGWKEILEWVLLGIRNTVQNKLGSPSQRLYGTNVSLPGDIFHGNLGHADTHLTPLKRLREGIQSFPRNFLKYEKKPYLPKEIEGCKFVWLRKFDKKSMDSPYEGPYEVLDRDRTNKTIIIVMDKNGIHVRTSIDRLKPAWIEES